MAKRNLSHCGLASAPHVVLGDVGGGASPGRGPDQAAPTRGPGGAPHDPWRPDAGGGFGGLVLPSGTYVVQGDRVRWVPAVDVTVVTVAALVLARVVAGAWIRRRGHRGRSLSSIPGSGTPAPGSRGPGPPRTPGPCGAGSPVPRTARSRCWWPARAGTGSRPGP